ncbi:MAG: TonB-dependent receptor plug domain-containing protein [Bacteroidales bacterium]
MGKKDNITLITAYCFIFILIIFQATESAAQFVPYSKYIHEIQAVEVVRARSDFYGEDQKKTTIDTSVLQVNSSMNLDELISMSSPVFINNYGSSGSLSTPKFRGSSSNHTALSWNGFPINNVTMGQPDLSLAPAEFSEKISITHGASGSLYGSGTFGGSIDLRNDVNWNKSNYIAINPEYGSWNNQRYNLKGLVGNNSFKYRVNGIYHKADNDFPYNDTQKFGNPKETRKNNDVNTFAILQNLFFKPSPRNQFEAGIWVQHRKKNIPGLMGEYGNSVSTQKDSTIKAYVKWNKVFSESSLKIKTGYFLDNQLYTEKENKNDQSYSIYSPIQTKRWLNDLNYRHYVSDILTFDIGAQYSLINADVSAYESTIKEHRAALIGAAKFKFSNLTTNISFRQQFNNHASPKPQASIGAKYQIFSDKLYLRGNFSSKYRLPTFNDKYWNPGGNRDINPEQGWSGEGGLQYIYQPSPNLYISTEITGYRSKINDLIQWVPKSGESYWHAVNASKVQSTGIESAVKMQAQWNNVSLLANTFYNYTQSIHLEENKPSIHKNQLPYTPYHTFKNYSYIRYSDYSLGVSSQYTGKRYTNADNSTELPGYFVADVFAQRQIKLKNTEANVKFSIKNIFDNQYQVIAYYPMPGRAYYINIKIKLNNLF